MWLPCPSGGGIKKRPHTLPLSYAGGTTQKERIYFEGTHRSRRRRVAPVQPWPLTAMPWLSGGDLNLRITRTPAALSAVVGVVWCGVVPDSRSSDWLYADGVGPGTTNTATLLSRPGLIGPCRTSPVSSLGRQGGRPNRGRSPRGNCCPN